MSLRSRFGRVALVAVCIVVTSFVASVVVTQYLWGYWISPPRAVELHAVDRVTSGSRVSYDNGASRVQPLTREEIRLAKLAIIKRGTPDIPEQRFLAFLDGPPSSLSDSKQVTALLTTKARVPDRLSPGYEQTASYWEGVILTLRMRDGEERIVFARHTGETTNDRHFYVESMYDSANGQPLLRNEVSYYFDFAGLEGLTSIWLFAIAAGMLCGVVAILKGISVLIRRMRFDRHSAALN